MSTALEVPGSAEVAKICDKDLPNNNLMVFHLIRLARARVCTEALPASTFGKHKTTDGGVHSVMRPG